MTEFRIYLFISFHAQKYAIRLTNLQPENIVNSGVATECKVVTWLLCMSTQA